MKEFKQIEKAPLYEMDKDGNIQKMDTKVSAIPYPTGSRNIILTMGDGKRQTFVLDTLISETFGEKKQERVVAPEPLEEEFHTQIQEDEKESREENILQEANVVRATEETTYESEDKNLAKDEPAMTIVGDLHVPQVKKGRERPKKIKDVNEVVKEKGKRGRPSKPKTPKKDFSSNPMIAKIMALETFDSVKIWKLHNIGVTNADITEIVDALHETVIAKTLEQYKQKEKLRNRAEKVIV